MSYNPISNCENNEHSIQLSTAAAARISATCCWVNSRPISCNSRRRARGRSTSSIWSSSTGPKFTGTSGSAIGGSAGSKKDEHISKYCPSGTSPLANCRPKRLILASFLRCITSWGRRMGLPNRAIWKSFHVWDSIICRYSKDEIK